MPSLGKCVVAGAVAAFCTAAAAEQSACKEDVQLLCDKVEPGQGRVLACLKDHQDKVSTNCKVNLERVQEAVKQVSSACEPDIEQFCMNTPAGKGAIANCLKKHQGQLSTGCKGAVAKVKARTNRG